MAVEITSILATLNPIKWETDRVCHWSPQQIYFRREIVHLRRQVKEKHINKIQSPFSEWPSKAVIFSSFLIVSHCIM